MFDLIYVAYGIVFFIAAIAYAFACEKL